MRSRSALVEGSATVGASHLGLILLMLVGFFAMHGLAATVGGIEHYSPAAVVAATGHGQPMSDLAPDLPTAPRGHQQGAADGVQATPSGPGDSSGLHALIAGCVFVLCGVILLLAAHLMRVMSAGHQSPVRMGGGRRDERPARRPPRPIFLSLCLLRL